MTPRWESSAGPGTKATTNRTFPSPMSHVRTLGIVRSMKSVEDQDVLQDELCIFQVAQACVLSNITLSCISEAPVQSAPVQCWPHIQDERKESTYVCRMPILPLFPGWGSGNSGMHSGVHGTCDTPTCGSSLHSCPFGIGFRKMSIWYRPQDATFGSGNFPPSSHQSTTCCHRCSLTTRTTSSLGINSALSARRGQFVITLRHIKLGEPRPWVMWITCIDVSWRRA